MCVCACVLLGMLEVGRSQADQESRRTEQRVPQGGNWNLETWVTVWLRPATWCCFPGRWALEQRTAFLPSDSLQRLTWT